MPAAQPSVRVRGLSKAFGEKNRVQVLQDVSLDVWPGERVVLLGPSGCGKTTLLRCIAGLEQPDSGEIEVAGKVVFSSSRGIFTQPDRRNVNMVFQSYALWPHMSVDENVAFPLVNARITAGDVARRVREALEMVGCGGLGARYPAQLSGGQQQRVALARAVVGGDTVILFDEPLSNIDAQVREQLRVELVELQSKIGFSALYVTHDQTEASALANRVAIMASGDIVQLDTPEQLYRNPKNAYVASFIGSTNAIPGRVTDVAEGSARIETQMGNLIGKTSEGLAVGDSVLAFIRPEDVSLLGAGKTTSAREGRVLLRTFLGFYCDYKVDVAGVHVVVRQMNPSTFQVGDVVEVDVAQEYIHLFKT